jgi:hypothetical protein
MPEPPELDRERIEALMERLGTEVKAHYLGAGGPSQGLVYEALNALACQVALILGGVFDSGGLDDCLEFFSTALTNQVNAILSGLQKRDNAGGNVH